MDSFLDEPRALPKPTPVIQEIQAPSVPEVSLMFQNSKRDQSPIPVNFGKSIQSYNAWKLRNNSNNNQEYDSFLLTTNKENVSTVTQSDKSFLSKKQVRFESPVQKTSPVSHYPITRQKRVTETSPLGENSFKNVENQNNSFKQRYNTGHCSSVSNSNENNAESSNHIFKSRQVTPNYSPRFSATNHVEPAKEISKPFEKMYVSNIPNRELDLSFLEPQNNPCSSIKTQAYTSYKPASNNFIPKTYERNNDSFKAYSPRFNKIIPSIQSESPIKINPNIITEIRRLSDYKPAAKINEIQVQKQDEATNTSNISTNIEQIDKNCDENKVCDSKISSEVPESKCSSNDTVTVSDLLTIIKMQNEQLQKLQSQVEKLVQLSEKTAEEKTEKTTEHIEQNKQELVCKDQQVGPSSESHENTIEKDSKKISVGLMTSFEVSFKPPVPKKKNKTRNLQPVEDESLNSSAYEPVERQYYRSPRKQTYTSSRKSKKEYRNQQQPRQQEDKRIPPNQWNFKGTNETEYSLGSQESLEIQEQPESPENSIHIDMQEYDTDSSDDECSTDEGWTFYKDILGQVNHLLENSSRPAYKPRKEAANRNYNEEDYTDTTLEQIKHATMKRLQTDGFLQTNNDQLPMKPTEVSFAVKQILMKYLPDDGLANAVTRNNQDEHYKPDKRKPTDISVTAFKYMQQCNVVRNAPHCYGRKGKNIIKKSPSRNKIGAPSSDPKILDITTLKQQPKFL